MTKGKSLLSCNQVRAHNNKVHNTPRCYGGRQAIITQNGTHIPLKYTNVLCMLPTKKPMKWELENIEPIELTSGVPWDPSRQNDEDFDQSIDPNFHLEDEPVDGGYQSQNQEANKFTKEEGHDQEHIQRCLGYKPKDICQKTLNATTQFARQNEQVTLKEHYKARFPALNVRRINEIFATDTFFASEKAIGGYTCAQIFVGKHPT